MGSSIGLCGLEAIGFGNAPDMGQSEYSFPLFYHSLLPPSVVVWRYGGSFRCFFVVRGSETSGCLTSHGHADLVDNAFIFSVPVLTGRGL